MVFIHKIASPELNTTVVVQDTIAENGTKYIDYSLPEPKGITIQINSTSKNCRLTVYGSAFIRSPNEAFHDIKLDVIDWEDGFVLRSDTFNPATAKRLFLAIMTQASDSCVIHLSAEEGDVSTGKISWQVMLTYSGISANK